MISLRILEPRLVLLRVLWPWLLVGWIGTGLSVWLWRDTIGWNLLAEAIGATFVIICIDRALDEAEERRLRPARLAMMREGITAYRRLNGLINDAQRSALHSGGKPSVSEIGSKDDELLLASVLAKLDLTTSSPNAGIIAQKLTFLTWREALAKRLAFSAREVERFITRYASVSDPELHEAMQQLENTTLVSFGAVEDLFLAVGSAVGERQWVELIRTTSNLHPILKRLVSTYGLDGDHSLELSEPAVRAFIHDLTQSSP